MTENAETTVTSPAVLPAEPAHPDIAALRDVAIQSMTLAIELFNRPNECGRPHTVVILLHHCFEMMLKSLILEARGCVFDEERGFSYGFDKCLVIAEEEGMITGDQRKFLSILDNARDTSTHYYQTIPEPILYIFSQASVSLFNQLIKAATGKGLLEILPQRVVMLSAISPQKLGQVLEEEFEKLRELLNRPDMSKAQGLAMLRPLMAFMVGGEDRHRRMTNDELKVAAENLAAAETWRVVFPEISKIEFDSAGDDIHVGFKVVKESTEAMPVRILKPEEAHLAQGTIIMKEISLFDKFNLNLTKLAENLGLTSSRTQAMIRAYDIQSNPECFRCLPVGSSNYKRYSKLALDRLREKVGTAEECWKKHAPHLTSKKKDQK